MIAMLIVQILMITKMFGFDALSQSQAEIVQQVLLLSLSIMQSIAFTWSMISTKNLAKNSTVALILTAGSLLVYWLCLMNMRYGIGKIAPIMLVNIINSSISSFGSGFKQLQKINNWQLYLSVAIICTVILVFLWIRFNRAYYPIQQIDTSLSSSSKPILVPINLNIGAMMTYMIGLSILMLPSMLATHFAAKSLVRNPYFDSLITFFITFLLFYFFSFFQYDPGDQAKILRDTNNYLLNIRPGKPTKKYLTGLLIKILLPGAFLNALIITISLWGPQMWGEKANFAMLLANFAMTAIFFLSIKDEVSLYLFPIRYQKLN
jgi:preprotein translocase subunit SecY